MHALFTKIHLCKKAPAYCLGRYGCSSPPNKELHAHQHTNHIVEVCEPETAKIGVNRTTVWAGQICVNTNETSTQKLRQRDHCAAFVSVWRGSMVFEKSRRQVIFTRSVIRLGDYRPFGHETQLNTCILSGYTLWVDTHSEYRRLLSKDFLSIDTFWV